MAFITPLSLLFALLALPILVLYMLKLRRREIEVPSIFLWQMVMRDREANAPWQRLRRNLLLYLQLLLLALLVLAMARPFIKTPTLTANTLVVLLDASASMQATDGGNLPTRFEAARATIQRLIDDLPTHSTMTLILVGQQPQVLAAATNDKGVLHHALQAAQVENGSADWTAALALAAGAVRVGNQDDAAILIVSDGGLPDANLPALPTQAMYLPTGNAADNLALSALATRHTPAGPQLFASVANYGNLSQTALLSIYLNDKIFTTRQMEIPAGEVSNLVLSNLPPTPAIYTARLSLPVGSQASALDHLPLDDVAWTIYHPPFSARALIISPGNIFLEQALAAQPDLQPYRLRPEATVPTEGFDLYVYDGLLSETLPDADLLLINPLSNPLFTVGEVFTNTTVLCLDADNPLLRGVKWDQVHIQRARHIQPPAWAQVLIEAEGGPLVFVGENSGRRIAVLAFDLHDSDLPLQVAYPILITNLINYLAPAQPFSAPDGLRPGETLTLRSSSGATAIGIIAPDDTRYTVPTTSGSVVFADTHQLGVYTVVSDQKILGYFAVNLFQPEESRIRPATTIQLGHSPLAPPPQQEKGQWEIWPWLIAVAIIVLLVEWWLYHRGSTLPVSRDWRDIFLRRKMTV